MAGQRRTKHNTSKQWGYAAAVMLSIAALALTHYLAPILAPDTAAPLLIAVAVSAYAWGLGPGLLTAFFTASGSAVDSPSLTGHGIMLSPQTHWFSDLAGNDFLRLALFMATAMLIASLRPRAKRAATAGADTNAESGEQFMAAAAHELRTPLTAIYGQAQLLRRRLRREVETDERILRSVDVMVRQADRLNKTVNAFIDVASIGQGLLTLDRAPLDLDALVRRVVAEARQQDTPHCLSITSPVARLLVLGDEARLTQALEALLDNAVRFSPTGDDITIAVTSEGQQAQVTISDRGIGIPSEALPHVFDSFYRAPNAEAMCLSGAGVGLYVVRAIIEQHGGTVTATNRPSGGSILRLTLPLLDK